MALAAAALLLLILAIRVAPFDLSPLGPAGGEVAAARTRNASSLVDETSAAGQIAPVRTPAPAAAPGTVTPTAGAPSATASPSGSPGRTSYTLHFPLILQSWAAPTPTPQPTATPTLTPVPTSTPTAAPPRPTNTPAPAGQGNVQPRTITQVSPYQKLSDYPRPSFDTGYGFHINGSPYPPPLPVMRDRVVPLLKSLGATWVTLWLVDTDWIDWVKLLQDNGIEVVVRYQPLSRPHPEFIPKTEEIKKYVDIGVHYFQPGNEPNLVRENPYGTPEQVAMQWVEASKAIKAAGGIPVLYPMSPGGDIPHREFLTRMFEWMAQNGQLDSLDGAAIAVHNRPHNKPPDHRDSTSFLEYEWVDDLVNQYIGRSLPILGTEAGYTFGDLIDSNFPRIDAELHEQYNLEIIDGFSSGRWRPALFTQNFWILGGFGHDGFLADRWVDNPLNFGRDLPIVAALQNREHLPRVPPP